jgi:lipopolysaccharide export system permease protein
MGMRRLSKHIFWRTTLAFSAVMVLLTAIVWVTQALRRFDLVTAKGQAIAVYFGMTFLGLPSLVVYIAPFALAIAMAIVLNAMHSDSELIAANAAGVSQRQVLRPFLALAVLVGLAMGWIAFFSGPQTLQTLRDITNAVRADIVANVIQPGRFVEIDDDFTFHIRNRAGDGSLEGLFIYDARDPVHVYTYSAERGRVAEFAGRTLVVMENGTIERTKRDDSSSTFVAFGSYGFDLTELAPSGNAAPYQINERTVPELLSLAPDDPVLVGREARVRAEVLGRVAVTLYPLVMTLAVFLFLGFPKTTRSGRTGAVIGGLATAALARLAGFGVDGLAGTSDLLVPLVLAVPVGLILLFGGSIALGLEPYTPRFLGEPLARLGDVLERLSLKRATR